MYLEFNINCHITCHLPNNWNWFKFQSNDACREKEEMACRYEKWRWKEIKSYFLNAVSRRKGDEMKKYPYLYQKQSSVSNCC